MTYDLKCKECGKKRYNSKAYYQSLLKKFKDEVDLKTNFICKKCRMIQENKLKKE